MSAKVGSLNVDLTIETARFQRGLSEAQRAADAAGRNMGGLSKTVGGLSKSFIALGGVVAGSALVGGLTRLVKSGLDYASSLGETAQQLGITATALQEYSYAAQNVGISQEELEKGFGQLTRRIGEAVQGNAKQAEAFARLGIALKDARGNVLNAADAIPKLADGFLKVQNPAERAAFAAEFFGSKLGGKFQTLLANGSAAIRQFREDAHKLGLVLGEEEIQKADDTADKIGAVNRMLQVRLSGIVVENADSILTLANSLGTLVAKAGAAFNAMRQMRLEMSAFSDNITANSPFVSQEIKDAAANRRDMARALAARLAGTTDKSGAFRDYRAAPLNLGGGARASGLSDGDGGSSRSGGGRSGPSAAEIAQRAAQNAARFEDQVGRLRIDQLQAEQEYTGNIRAKRDVSLAAISEDLASFKRNVALDNDLTAAQRATLIERQTTFAMQKSLNAEQEYGRDLAERNTAITTASLNLQMEDLRARSDLADNSRDKLSIEREILDLSDRLRLAELDRVLAVEATSSAAWENAKVERDHLLATGGDRRRQVDQAFATPGMRFRDSLKLSVGQMNDAIESIKIEGLDALNDGLAAAMVGTAKLGDVFKNVAAGIVADLLKIELRRAIIAPLAKLLNIGGGGSAFDKAFADFPLPKLDGARAAGGPVNAGGLYLVGEKGPELMVPGASGTVIPNNALGGGRNITVHVHAKDAVLTSTVRRWVAEGIGIAIEGGSNAGVAKMAYRQSRRIA